MTPDARSEVGRSQALATVGMIGGLASLAVGGAFLAAVVVVAPESGPIAGSILDSLGRTGHAFLVGMGVAVILVSALGHAWGANRQ